jgi:phytoene dehydrogenase-like protein
MAARGELPDDPAIWVVATSGVDPTQAPEGQESLYIHSLAAPVHPREGWQALRAPAVGSILAKLGKYIGPLEEAEIGRLVETPEDLGARLSGAPEWEIAPDLGRRVRRRASRCRRRPGCR